MNDFMYCLKMTCTLFKLSELEKWDTTNQLV